MWITNRRRRAKFAVVALSGALLVAACGSESNETQNDSQPRLKYRLAIGTLVPGIQQATYSALPIALGYWADEGIDVELSYFEGAAPALQAVEAGKADGTIVSHADMLRFKEQGGDFLSFYNVITKEYVWPVVPENSPIKTVRDLVGKKVGVPSPGSATARVNQAYYAAGGGDPAKMNMVSVGFGATAVEALKAGRVDWLATFDGDYAAIKYLLNYPVRIVTEGADWGDAAWQQSVMSKPEYVEKNRKMLAGLGRGMAKAQIFAEANSDCTVKLMWQQLPKSKPVGIADNVALEQSKLLLKTRLELQTPIDGKWGYVKDEQIKAYQQMLLKAGIIKQEFPSKDIWDGSMVEDVNRFDADAVKRSAQQYKC